MARLSSRQICTGLDRLREDCINSKYQQVNLLVWDLDASGGEGPLGPLFERSINDDRIDDRNRVLLLERIPSAAGGSVAEGAKKAVRKAMEVR